MILHMNRNILNRAKKIKLLAMDVDGVLTGGEILILNSGEEVKIWSVKDRMGFALLRSSGLPIKLAWITARGSLQVQKRSEDLKIDFLFQKSPNKWKQLEACAKSLGLKNDEVAFVGDDYVDLPCLKRAGLAVCPPESPDILKKVCHYQTKASSGKGVIREVIEILIQAQGAWKKAMAQFSVFLLCLFLTFTGCSQKVPNQEFTEKPDQWIERFTITETLGGMPVWILNSETAQVFEKKQKVTLDDIKIQFMNTGPVKKKRTQQSLMLAKKNQTQAARLTAPKGEVDLNTKDLAAWGGVEVQTDDGTKLYTERLMFSTSRQKILSDSPVKIVRQDSILLGEGLEATPDLETVKILRHQASIYPKNIQLQEAGGKRQDAR